MPMTLALSPARCRRPFPMGGRGRYAPRARIDDHLRAAVVALDAEQPSAAELLRRVAREMKIRFYPRLIHRDFVARARRPLEIGRFESSSSGAHAAP